MKYQVTDGHGADIEIEAESALEACEQYVSTGDWGSDTKTTWVTCRATPIGEDGEPDEADDESHTVEIEPTEPDCSGGEHDWAAPHSVVGGLMENPGVHGHGGGVICTEVCRHCGAYKITDTWAQNPANGQQGLRSIEYLDADEASEAWLVRRAEAAEE